jgi:hypothetical protein
VLAAINLGFGFTLAEICQTLDQPHRAFITWQHHSFDPYGGNAVLAAINLGFGMALLAEIRQTFDQQVTSNSVKRGHGMSKISHTEPS